MTEAAPTQEATIEGTDETWMSAWDALEFVSLSMLSIGAGPGTGIGVESGTRVMRISMGWFGWWRA